MELRVIDQLEKWVDQATLEAVRAQGGHVIASQRLAHYLHSEIRGRLLRLSMSLRQAMDNQDPQEALRILDDLEGMVTKLSPQASAVPPQENLQEFLANWGSMIDLSHNFDTVSLPPSVAIATEAIVMEAVNDAVRHSHASQVDVTITQDADVYLLVISSDGGSPPSVFSPGLGTRILDTYAPGRWSREGLDYGGQSLTVELSVALPSSSR
jgi:glucose-6-phosphate-specific signal transduction histidine kinase